MNNTTRYTTQPAGTGRARVLATRGKKTRTVATTGSADADAVAAALQQLADDYDEVLHESAREHIGKVSPLRRALMGAVAGTRPDVPEPVTGLAAVAATLPEAERRSVVDEVGRLFEGTETVLVPATVAVERTGQVFRLVANDWLDSESDAGYLAALLDETGDGYALYEGLLAHLRTGGGPIDDAADSSWVDVRLDRTALAYWLRTNRPAAAPDVAEYLCFEDLEHSPACCEVDDEDDDES